MSPTPFERLGVPDTASEEEIRSAWRALAQLVHPDAGGSHAEMVELNAALHDALRSGGTTSVPSEPTTTRSRKRVRTFVARDVSSFTINELPVDAFESLTLAAAHCGQVLDDDPPYVIEFTMHDMGPEHLRLAVCRCELMPEAGATTVHLSIAGAPQASIESVRDALVDIVNELAG